MPKTKRRLKTRSRDRMHLSFSGCGFLGIYHVGVCSAFYEYARDICDKTVIGASAGSLAAVMLMCGGNTFGEATTSILRLATNARKRALGPFHPGFDINRIIFEDLEKMLPENAHELCSGKLHISVTRVSDGANVILSQFDTRDELITAVMGSCFIPFFSGILPPRVKGVSYIDGGFSDNLPVFDENTITVSPFAGESDICPSDESFNLLTIQLCNTSISVSPANLYRMTRILFAPHPEVLSNMCQQGFDDAVKYLQRHNLISCTRCLAVESVFHVQAPSVESLHSHSFDGCDDCKEHQQMAVVGSLPEQVVRPIQDAADKLNQGIINWVFRHKPVKVVSLLTAPYILPFDIGIAAAEKLVNALPAVQKELVSSLNHVVNKLTSISISDSTKGSFSCQLAITEFNYNPTDKAGRVRSRSLDSSSSSKPSNPRKNRCSDNLTEEKRVVSELNLDFEVDLNQPRRKTSMINALKSFEGDNIPAVDAAIEMTNEVLQNERKSLASPEAKSLERMLDATNKQEALMAFYYTDENNTVKVTEIFDVSTGNSHKSRNQNL